MYFLVHSLLRGNFIWFSVSTTNEQFEKMFQLFVFKNLKKRKT